MRIAVAEGEYPFRPYLEFGQPCAALVARFCRRPESPSIPDGRSAIVAGTIESERIRGEMICISTSRAVASRAMTEARGYRVRTNTDHATLGVVNGMAMAVVDLPQPLSPTSESFAAPECEDDAPTARTGGARYAERSFA